jgi:DNA-binding transcriptional MerR regulator
MNRAAVAIPEKLFFKIGEVCDLTGIQAHVLRYWESEFPMLAPQKNRAGQRTYRKRDVEMVLRIKELLYDELYTIAGAKKKLISELRGASKLKVVSSEPNNSGTQSVPSPTINPVVPPIYEPDPTPEPSELQNYFAESQPIETSSARYAEFDGENRTALLQLKEQLQELLKLLDESDAGRRDGRR